MVKKRLRGALKKVQRPDEATVLKEAAENAPRITNETVAEHRETVLKGARKYIVPLQHNKHQIVVITSTLFIVAVITFFSYVTLALYKFHQSSTFLYRVTQVIPFPVAKTGGHYVSYENYLFELRHYKHYYETQQKLNFADAAGKQQLEAFEKQARQKVVDDALVRQLASENGVSVSNKEVSDQIVLVRNQNRLGENDKVFEDVLKDYWGWTVNDFKRSLRQQMLAQKLVAKLDTESQTKASAALAELHAGADFAATAKKYSEDPTTKDNGGEFGFAIARTNRDLTAQTVSALFALQPGQISEVVNTGYTLEIVKNIETTGDRIRGAHIVFNLKDVNTYLDTLKDKQKTTTYIR
jgi:type III secretion system FlhB-like substrate exporter